MPLPVDESGACAGDLAESGAQAAVVTPAHQYPTGVTLQPGRRADLVAWARAHDAIVIEDDYDGEFRYDRQPVGALQGLAPDHVVYVGTTSKTLAPGVRVGWLVLPERLVEPVVETRRAAGATTASLEQLVLADLLRRGQIDRHLRRLRNGYRQRRDALVGALARELPQLQPTGISAGLHLLVELPQGLTEEDVRVAAERRQVALAYLASNWHRPGPYRQGVVVGYSRPPAASFSSALRALVAVLREAAG